MASFGSAAKRADQLGEVVGVEVDVGVDLDDHVDVVAQRRGGEQEAVEVARLAAAVGQRLLAVGLGALVDADPGVLGGQVGEHVGRAVGRPVVDDRPHEGRQVLADDRRGEPLEVGLLVARRGDDGVAQARSRGHPLGRRRHRPRQVVAEPQLEVHEREQQLGVLRPAAAELARPRAARRPGRRPARRRDRRRAARSRPARRRRRPPSRRPSR